MRKIIYIAFVLLLTGSVQGQQNNCLEAVGISTDPADPVNSQCDGDFLNTFDWMQEKFKVEDFNCVQQPVDSVESPFDNTGALSTYHFTQQDIKDYLPEDGWELLRYKNTTDNLSFVMYNKYTSDSRFKILFYNFNYLNILFQIKYGKSSFSERNPDLNHFFIQI